MIVDQISDAEVPSDANELLELVRAEIRQSHEFGVFSILPGLTTDMRSIKKFAKDLGIDSRLVDQFIYRLIGAGLWKVEGNEVQSKFELLELGDISVKDYLSMAVGIISQLSDAKSHTYDTLSIVTNRALIRAYLAKVNQALKELYQQSQAEGVLKECIFSWNHTGVVEVEKKNVGGKGPNKVGE